jgi:predicted RNA-binding protein with PIN domain
MILVDGHNLFFKVVSSRVQIKKQIEKLLKLLGSFQRKIHKKIIVIFDNSTFAGISSMSREVEVVFSPPGFDADEVIIQRVKSSKDPAGIKIVTSDLRIKEEVEKLGARVITSKKFLQDICERLKSRNLEYPQKEEGISKECARYWLKKFKMPDG